MEIPVGDSCEATLLLPTTFPTKVCGLWLEFPGGCDDDGGEVECKKATKYHLDKAGITDEHEFKKDWGAVPLGHYEICACDDGSIKIAGRGECGKSGPKIDTDAHWK